MQQFSIKNFLYQQITLTIIEKSSKVNIMEIFVCMSILTEGLGLYHTLDDIAGSDLRLRREVLL